jgi:protein SCO1/2
VTHNFAVIDATLAKNSALYGKTHLICVSFDPEHDTPERLRAYGATYIGRDDKKAFAHWDFATTNETALLEMAKFFDVGITHGADDSITHTLSTTLIGPDGKVADFYPGNEWTPEQVVGDVMKLQGYAG